MLSQLKSVPWLCFFPHWSFTFLGATFLIFIGSVFFVPSSVFLPSSMFYHILLRLPVQFLSRLTYQILCQVPPIPSLLIFFTSGKYLPWFMGVLALIWASCYGGLWSWDWLPMPFFYIGFPIFFKCLFFSSLVCSNKSPWETMTEDVIILIFCISSSIFILLSHWNERLAVEF